MMASTGPLMPKINRQSVHRPTSRSPTHHYHEDQLDETASLIQHASDQWQPPDQSTSSPVNQSSRYAKHQHDNVASPPIYQPNNQSLPRTLSREEEDQVKQVQLADSALQHAYSALTQSDTTPVKPESYATSPTIQLSIIALWISLFILLHTSTPLVMTLLVGTLIAYSLEIAGMYEISAIICLLSSVTLSLLIMFFHDIPMQLSSLMRISIICSYLVSLLCLMIWFTLRSPLIDDQSFWRQRLLGELLLMAILPVMLTMSSVMAIASMAQMDYSNIAFLALIIYLVMIEICCIRPTVSSPDIVYWHAVFVLLWPWITHSLMHPRAAYGQYFFSECLLLISISLLGLARLSYLHNRADRHPLGNIPLANKNRFEKQLATLGLYGFSTAITLRLVIPILSAISWRVEHNLEFWTIVLVITAWAACTSLVSLLSIIFVSNMEDKMKYWAVHMLFADLAAGVVTFTVTGSLWLSFIGAIGYMLVELSIFKFIQKRNALNFVVMLILYYVIIHFVMNRSFRFLDVNFTSVLTLSSVLTLIVMTALVGVIAPVLPVIPMPLYSDIGRFGVVFYFSLLTMCEVLLFQQNSTFETAVWPWECVVLTSVIGFILARFLFTRKRIEAPVYSMLVCVCIAKLGLLLVDTTMDFLQCAAIVVSVVLPALWPPQGKPRLIAHGTMIVIAFWCGKNSVLAHIMALIGFDSANEATYLAAFLVAVSICLAPLTYLRASSPEVRRGHLYLVIVTICFALTQPRMPGLLDSQSDILSENMHAASVRDWYLFLALALTSLNIVSLVPLPSVTLAIVAGALFGMYIASAMTFHVTLYVFFVTICIVASLIAERVATARAIPPRAAASRALPYLINGCLVLAYFAATTINIGLLEHSEWSALFLAPILIFTQPASSRTFTIRFDRFMGVLLAIYACALPVTLTASFVLFSDEVMHQVHILLLTLYASIAIVIAVVGSIKQGTFLASSSTVAKGKQLQTSNEGRYFVAAAVLSVNLICVACLTLFWSNYSLGWQLAQSATLLLALPAAATMVMSLATSPYHVSPVLGMLALVAALVAAALTQLGSVRALAIMSAVVIARQAVDLL